MKKSDKLPKKFSSDERRAYDWIYDCQIANWLVDLATKEVVAGEGKYPGLVEFARSRGMQ